MSSFPKCKKTSSSSLSILTLVSNQFKCDTAPGIMSLLKDATSQTAVCSESDHTAVKVEDQAFLISYAHW
jgi:hypothetical protein